MNSFREYRGKWWWFVVGKGQKKSRVPVNDEMLEALMRYRRFLGEPPLPAPDDVSPLLRSIKGNASISSNMVYRLVKGVVKAAAQALKVRDPYRASRLEKASTHWLRHTAVTHGDDAGIDLKYLNRSARHEKLETTGLYQHADDDVWHDMWQKHRFK